MLKLVFVAPKFRLRRVQKRGKKEQKLKNCGLSVHELDIVLGVNTDRKNRMGKVFFVIYTEFCKCKEHVLTVKILLILD